MRNVKWSISIWEGVKKKINFFKRHMSPKLWPPPLFSPLRGQKKEYIFPLYFITISLDPVLRLGVTIQKNSFNKKCFFETCWIFFTFCLKKYEKKLAGMGGGVDPPTCPQKRFFWHPPLESYTFYSNKTELRLLIFDL